MSTPRHALERQIQAAFADTASRPAPPLVQDRGRASYEASVEARFAEHPGEMTPAVLQTHVASARELRPRAERWFWRSLLLAAVRAPWERCDDRKHPDSYAVHSLLHTTVWWLRANPCAVLAGRTDDDVQNLRERLAPAQRIAVSCFLGAVLRDPVFADRHMADLASQAILWCWTDDPAITAVADAHHKALRSYSRPACDNAHDESRVQAIERAFADTPAPTGPLMLATDEEPASYALAFRGTDWRRLTPRLVDHNATAFSFMSPDAFRYFIPAVLCHELGPGSAVDALFHLVTCVISPSPFPDAVLQRIRRFSPDERWAIVNFLHFEAMSETDPERLQELESAMALWESFGD